MAVDNDTSDGRINGVGRGLLLDAAYTGLGMRENIEKHDRGHY